ncbi:amidohydrolase [Tenacibaculum ovolyticum]|uniref:amidohydrolase n=1 Tax=Tenacibaculum ovolyticum TaxID=104270 RepID=UPI0022F406D7|nr:amidohydrolase [Tenacibaculum ovolyticum]WBX76862.1 amidohydrolase [Tenacibaculum ovolyticum]
MNLKTLKTALIQSDLVWENPNENLKYFEEKINSISEEIHLIILPEMFTTGFTMNPQHVAENMNGKTIHWMIDTAKHKNCALTGSIIIKENNQFFNRLLFVHPCGKIEFYDKKHLFTLANEHKTFSSGNKRILINYKGWKISPLICYDLRFPAWARNIDNYDLLLYVASWPTSRINAWNTLLKARAIENMVYTIGVNRVGTDANGYEYNGNSVCYDALGSSLVKNDTGTEEVLIVHLNKKIQDTIRNKFRFLEDKDLFTFQ